MSSNRITGNEGIEALDVIETEDQLLYTNRFLRIPQEKDISNEDKDNFKRYIEQKRKKEYEDNIRKTIKQRSSSNSHNIEDDDSIYSPFASVHINELGIKKKGKDKYVVGEGSMKIDKQESVKVERESIVAIDTADRDVERYPLQNNFTTFLGKIFRNVKKIELISTEIPNTDQVIKDTPSSIKNNLISWENEEDKYLGYVTNVTMQTNVPNTVDITLTNHTLSTRKRNGELNIVILNSNIIDGHHYATILDSNTIRIKYNGGIPVPTTCTVDTGIPNYTVDITPGNYSALTLTAEIQRSLNLVKRRDGTGIFHYFEVTVNLDTDIIVFHSVIIRQLIVNPIQTSSGSNLVTISQTDHGYYNGDPLLITGVKNVGGYSSTLLNGNFTSIVLDSNTLQYEVNERAVESAVGGGTTVKTGKKANFRLLFDTANSLIVNHTGFSKEDSSESIGATNPITTKALQVSNIEIISSSRIRFTTVGNHGLDSAYVLAITNITSGTNPVVTTSTAHNLSLQDRVEIKNTNTVPPLSGTYSVQATGPTTFIINNYILQVGGNTGIVKHSGGKIQVRNTKTVPNIDGNIYFVENVTLNTFEVEESITYITPESIQDTILGTSQVFVNHPLHGFNTIVSITPVGATKALITTSIPHGLEGTFYEGAVIESIVTNTVDISITNHGRSTSDVIKIIDSASTPIINGTYVVQVVDNDTLRINLVGGISVASTATILTGDTTLLSNTNSIPSVDLDSLNQTIQFVNTLTPTTFEIKTGFLIATPGTYGLLNREISVSLYRIEAEDENGSHIGGIPISIINNQYRIIGRIIDENNYMVRTIDYYATHTSTAGGSNVKVTSERHGYRDFQSNTVDGTSSGKLYKAISLEGENYILLLSKDLRTVFTPNNDSVGDVFAKILLNEPPGIMMFNSYISAPKVFDPAIPSIETMSFQVKRGDGNFFNFTNMNFSFSLRITEIIEQSKDNYYSSQVGGSDFGYSQLSRQQQL